MSIKTQLNYETKEISICFLVFLDWTTKRAIVTSIEFNGKQMPHLILNRADPENLE